MGPGVRGDDAGGRYTNSKRALAQSRNIRRARARRGPAEAAILFGDRDVVDTRFAPAHQAGFIELPLFVPVGAVPLPGVVLPLVLKPHRDVIAIDRPELLDHAILMSFRPFAGDERAARAAAFEEFGAVTPA